MFSVREALLAEHDLSRRMLQGFLLAGRFLESSSAAAIVGRALEGREHRSAVVDALGDGFHVGFMAPNEPGALDTIARAARETGFGGEHALFASSAIALELGTLVGRPAVPTTILKAHGDEGTALEGYVEVFVPDADRATIEAWIRAEIGTHVGLRLASRAAMPTVVEAFLAEGYRVPEFLREGAIENPAEGSIVVYVDKPWRDARLRIELSAAAEGTA